MIEHSRTTRRNLASESRRPGGIITKEKLDEQERICKRLRIRGLRFVFGEAREAQRLRDQNTELIEVLKDAWAVMCQLGDYINGMDICEEIAESTGISVDETSAKFTRVGRALVQIEAKTGKAATRDFLEGGYYKFVSHCPDCGHAPHKGRCQAEAPNAQFRCACNGGSKDAASASHD